MQKKIVKIFFIIHSIHSRRAIMNAVWLLSIAFNLCWIFLHIMFIIVLLQRNSKLVRFDNIGMKEGKQEEDAAGK